MNTEHSGSIDIISVIRLLIIIVFKLRNKQYIFIKLSSLIKLFIYGIFFLYRGQILNLMLAGRYCSTEIYLGLFWNFFELI